MGLYVNTVIIEFNKGTSLMDVYTVLSSKPHNSHFLNRYVSFIERCKYKPSGETIYTEMHHICPKAKDMFPQYKSFTDHPWNCIRLSARQHFIAHMLLWKVYNNRSMTMTVYFINKVRYQKMNSRLYERLKIERSLYLKTYFGSTNVGMVNVIVDGAIRKIPIVEFNKGGYTAQHSKTIMVTDGVKSFRVPVGDPRYMSGELVGHTKDKTLAIDPQGNKLYVSRHDRRFETGELKGNNAGTITITNGVNNRRISPDAEIPSGWYRGMNKKDTKGSVWVNDGKRTRMIQGQIPEGWVKGRLFPESV